MQNKLSRRVLARAIADRLLAEPKRRHHWVKVLAAYLVEQNRVEEADLIVGDITHEILQRSGHALVDITTARPLTESIREALRRDLKAATKAKSVELTEHVDPTILGGLVARTPDGILDVSVRQQLKQLAAISSGA